MESKSKLLPEYVKNLKELSSYSNIPETLIGSFESFAFTIYRSDQQTKFSKPMPWIGMYIALASLFCILAMVADLLHGFRSKKLWFPCKYFTLNAASLSVIAVAMKLPVDLNNSMPGNVDQMAKLGSMAFMCTMMANSLPSLATMNGNELVTNIIALGVLVITLIVNVCIQIKTGVVSSDSEDEQFLDALTSSKFISPYVIISRNKSVAFIYVAMLLMLLITHSCSALMILTSKKILQSKYQKGHETALKEQQEGRLTIKKLKQHVSNYWIMADTGSPQFITSSSATTSTSGVICVISCVIHVDIMHKTIPYLNDYDSDYKWSMLVIFIIQFIGVVIGTIAPLSRCFTGLSYKLSVQWVWNHMNIFNVESYWSHKLYDLKWSGIPFPSSSRRSKIVVQNIKILILSFCIGFQKTLVVVCKTIGLIPIIVVICVMCSFRCWRLLVAIFIDSDIVLVETTRHHVRNADLTHYVLQLQDDMKLAERTLKRITKSVDCFIQKAEKQSPHNLMKLLDKSRSFVGVEIFDSHHIRPLLSEEPFNCWSLPVVTLISIAVSLPNIQTSIVDSLLTSVSEGLIYVTLVEESLNSRDDYLNIQKAAKTLWLEVEVYHKWLGYRLQKLAPQVNTAGQILEWFRDTAKTMVEDFNIMDTGGLKENFTCRSISADSMYRITQTILLSYNEKVAFVSEEKLFVQLSSMIADILATCLTNLPQVIIMKCHESAIEKREAGVQAATQLLGETTQIIKRLQHRELPCINANEMAFIENWGDCFKHSFP